MAALMRYEGAYPHRSAARPSAGWVHTPPPEAISELNESTVARCDEVMSGSPVSTSTLAPGRERLPTSATGGNVT